MCSQSKPDRRAKSRYKILKLTFCLYICYCHICSKFRKQICRSYTTPCKADNCHTLTLYVHLRPSLQSCNSSRSYSYFLQTSLPSLFSLQSALPFYISLFSLQIASSYPFSLQILFLSLILILSFLLFFYQSLILIF